MSKKALLAQLGRTRTTVTGEAFFTNNIIDTGNAYGLLRTDEPTLQLIEDADLKATWYVPEEVYSISIVAIGSGGSGEGSNTANAGSGGGGGGLVYLNDYDVYPGQELQIYVGPRGRNTTDGSGGFPGFPSAVVVNNQTIVLAGGGGGGESQNTPGKGAGGYGINGCVVRTGGTGGSGGTATGGCGGDAASYTSDGADGLSGNVGGNGGQGQSPYGEKRDGTEYPETRAGTAANGGVGADYGAGGGGANDELSDGTDYDGGDGGEGCVRIIWGVGRSFPDNAGEDESNGNVFSGFVESLS